MEVSRRGGRMVATVVALGAIAAVGAATATPAAAQTYPWETLNVYPWTLEDPLALDVINDDGVDLVGLGPGGVLAAEGNGFGDLKDPRVLIPGSYQALVPLWRYPDGIPTGDIVLITDESSPRMLIYQRASDGTLTETADIGLAGEQPQVAVGDFDLDAQFDLATLRADGLAALVRYGAGDGTFSAPQVTTLTLPAPPPGQSPSVARVLAAGWYDLAVATDDGAGNGQIYSLLGRSDRTLTQVDAGVPADGATALALGDLDWSSYFVSPEDLAMSAGGKLVVRWGNGDGTFSDPPFVAGDGSGTTPPLILKLFTNPHRQVLAGVSPYGGVLIGPGTGGESLGSIIYDDGLTPSPTPDDRIAVGGFFHPYPNVTPTFHEVVYSSAGNTFVQVVPYVPDTEITFRPQPEIYTHHTQFRFKDPDNQPVQFECRLNGGPWYACASGDDLGRLEVGDQLFEVRGRAAKWLDPTPASVSFRVAYPETVITHGPKPVSHGDRPAFAFASNAPPPVEFECAMDDEPFRPCNAGVAYVQKDPLKPGWHALQVRARTDTDLVDQIPDAWGFTVRGRRGGHGEGRQPGQDRLELSVVKTRIPDDAHELVDRGAAGRVVCTTNCVAKMKMIAKGSAARRMDFAGVIGHDEAKLRADREGRLVAFPRRSVAEQILHPTASGTLRIFLRFSAERR